MFMMQRYISCAGGMHEHILYMTARPTIYIVQKAPRKSATLDCIQSKQRVLHVINIVRLHNTFLLFLVFSAILPDLPDHIYCVVCYYSLN